METESHKSFGQFIIVWIGQLISSIGSGLTAFSLGVYAYQTTHAASSFALVTLCSFLPSILLRPIGGVLVDRFDRRLMMIIGDLGSVSGLILIMVTMLTGINQLWHIYLGVAISSVFVALQSPAYKASVTDMLSEDQFSKASGLVQLASSSQYLLSPIIAGFLLGVTTIKGILLIDISTFVVAILAVLVVKGRFKQSHKGSMQADFIQDLKDGWNAVGSNKGILLLVVVISLVTFYIGFLQTLLGPMVLSLVDAKTFGTVQSISAIGMLPTSLVLGVVAIRVRYLRLLSWGLALAGLFYSLMGISPNIYCITGACFLFFATLPLVNTCTDVLIRKSISNEQQGRAWGIIGVLSQLGYVAAYALAGFLADCVFNPLLVDGGLLASSVGRVIGTGPERGIGFLFVVSGLLVVMLAAIVINIKSVRKLE